MVDILLALLYVLPWILLRNDLIPSRIKSEKLTSWLRRAVRNRGWPDVVVTYIALLVALWIAFLVAVFPWEQTPFSSLTSAWFMRGADLVSQGPATWFSNRLVLSDQNLIEGIDLSKVAVTRAARNRSFYFAIFDRSDLRQIDFTGSDLSFASFGNANLQKAKLGCAYSSYDSSGASFGGCTQLREANLDSANMRGAWLEGAMMRGASLGGANLGRASLHGAQLQGATLDNANLDAADLQQVGLDGASLKYVSLIGANLFSARLRGTDLSRSTLFGATVDYVLAQNASFAGAQLQGASISWGHFEGTNFLATATYGTDAAGSDFSGARVENVMTTRRWRADYGYGTSIPDLSGDPFGKKGDNDPLPDDGGYFYASNDWKSPSYFADYTDIPVSEIDIDRSAAG